MKALEDGETLTETYTYTITDADGDTSTATLTITINGKDNPVTIIPGDPDPDGDGPLTDSSVVTVKEANLPDVVMQQTPKYMRRAKMPFVKAKVGPRVMTLIADPRVYEQIPVKKECKVTISGIYITEIKSVRGGSVLPLPQKKSLLDRIRFPKRSSKEAAK